MDKIIDALCKIIPLSDYIQKIGLSKELSDSISIFLIIILSYSFLYLVKYLINYYKNSITARDLAPYFEYKQVTKYRKYFIPTQFQNISPTKEEEPEFSNKFVSKDKVIPFFIKTVFDDKKDNEKFYLVLADSGMGKTTLLINLFVKYHSFFNFRRNYPMRLYPFGDDRILDRIKEIDPEVAKNTILLLDAFDEDKKLLQTDENDTLTDDDRFRKRMDEIIETVRDFREVIITSRTQYFPGQEDKSYELKIPRFDEKGFHILAKFYISPFDRKEIRHYLNKKYGFLRFWKYWKKKKALEIVGHSPKLMVRPMLLSYIDLLVDRDGIFKNTYEIYETLVDEWLNRESNKRKHKSSDRKKFKQDLLNYSRWIALEIYEHRNVMNLLSVSKKRALEIADEHNIDLKGFEITGQSLLTRDANSNWKFAHKSIWEYFIAKEMIDCFPQKMNLDGMDMARQFFNENVPYNLVFIQRERDKNETIVSDFWISKYPVTQKEWIEVMGSNPSCFKGDYLPVESVSWNKIQEFLNQLNKETGRMYRLPSEEEWEFAARGGIKSKGFEFAGSQVLDEVGWYRKNSKKKTHPVGEKKSNELDLYDMSGNVWEWTSSKEGSDRVFRGGSWRFVAEGCRVSYRYYYRPGYRIFDLGFRLAHSS